MLSTVLEILLGVLVVLVVTAVTGYFVAQEFGYMAVDRARLRARAHAGDAGARRALDITGRTSFMLSGAQLGITVTGLVVGYVAEPLIGAGLGVGLLPVDRPTAPGVRVLPLADPDVRLRAYAVIRTGRAAWPPLAVVVDLLAARHQS